MKRRRSIALTVATALFCLGAAAEAQAQSMSGGGLALYVPQAAESYQLPDGRTVQPLNLVGFVTANDPENPLHMMNQNCAGTTIVAPEGETMDGHGHCVGIDSEGDVAWLWWSSAEVGNTWGFLGGTGKFEGIEGGGTTAPGPIWPDGKYIITWEGTWEMK
ncbi:MAG: hypothetical protein AMS21_07385 [Gemmatimonas sp. SG8_38_2]|nr:MAG: hypothetical protein AMS21_07385 [Gemmatimonas sp. SG8_38_2]